MSTDIPLAPPLPVAGPSASTIPHPLEQSAPAPAPDPALSSAHEAESHPSGTGSVTPPIPKTHLRALVISGQSHVYSFEPEITVGRMKELVWSSWPSEWTDPAQPPSPSYLRILHAGRILQDDSTLGSNNLPASLTPSSPTVIHISVRSFSIRNDDEPKKPAHLGRTTSVSRSHREDDVGGCKCIIM